MTRPAGSGRSRTRSDRKCTYVSGIICYSREREGLTRGKLADLILLDGNPLEGYWNMLKTRVVLKGGVVVVDKR